MTKRSSMPFIAGIIGIVLILAVVISFAASDSKASKLVNLTGIEVSEVEHIDVGESATLSYKLIYSTPEGVSKRAAEKVTKKKAKKAVIEVVSFAPEKMSTEVSKENDGCFGTIILKGIKDGEVKYYIKCDEEKVSCSTIVGVLEPTGIEAAAELFVPKGKSVSVSASVTPKYANENITYEVEDGFVASVDSRGNVTFISTGETTVKSITSNGLVAVTKVTAAIEAENFTFLNHSITCSAGTVFFPGYKLVPEYVTYGSDVIYSSANENVVKYDASQKAFVAVGAGTTEVFGKFMSGSLFTDKMTVTVTGTRVSETIKPSDNMDDTPMAVINENMVCSRNKMTRLFVNNIKQKPELPNGCEITSATIALNYLGYKADKVTMADKYLDCEKPYYSVDPETAYMGNPHNTGWYCFAGVIEEAVNEYLTDMHSTDHKAYNITGSDFDTLKTLIDEGTPVVFWATLYFNKPYHSTKFTLPDGSYPYSNLHCLVLTGYDDNYAYIADPLGLTPKVEIEKFVSVYNEMGCRAVKIVPNK